MERLGASNINFRLNNNLARNSDEEPSVSFGFMPYTNSFQLIFKHSNQFPGPLICIWPWHNQQSLPIYIDFCAPKQRVSND